MFRLFSLLLALSVVMLAGCGNDDEIIHRPSYDSTNTRAHSLYQLARQAPDLKRFVAALEATGLSETLQHEGPFTVFAPSDAAFARSSFRADTMITGGQDSLRRVIERHIVRGTVGLYPIKDSMLVGTLRSDHVTLRKPARGPLSANREPVIRTVNGQNGILHVIRRVLLPVRPDTSRADTTQADSAAAPRTGAAGH